MNQSLTQSNLLICQVERITESARVLDTTLLKHKPLMLLMLRMKSLTMDQLTFKEDFIMIKSVLMETRPPVLSKISWLSIKLKVSMMLMEF